MKREGKAVNNSGTRRLVAPIRVLAAIVFVILSVLGGATPAGAHAGDQSYLYLDITKTSVGGRVEAPLRDINTALGLNIGGSDEEVVDGLNANLEQIHAYLQDHLRIEGGSPETLDAPWPITFTGADLFFSDLPEADDNYILFPFSTDVGTGEVPRVLQIQFDPFFDEIDGRDALLLIGNDWQGGVIENGHDVLTTFEDNNRVQQIDLGNTSAFKNFLESGKLGINHIRTGPDHILFVIVLLLPSVLVFTTRWEPAATFGSSLWRVLKIVTMFTVAHTITFTLAGLDILPLPSPRIIESIIAISIAAAAVHNIRPIAPNKEWLIAFAFGLFHGMGFASLVSGLDVDRGTQLVSLLGRNVGIEFGQSLVVLLLFPGLFLLRRTRYFRGFFLIVSGFLTVVSLGWMIERAFEVDLGVSTFVDPLVDWPRVLLYVAIFTAVVAGLHQFEKTNGRLLPVVGSSNPIDAEPATPSPVDAGV